MSNCVCNDKQACYHFYDANTIFNFLIHFFRFSRLKLDVLVSAKKHPEQNKALPTDNTPIPRIIIGNATTVLIIFTDLSPKQSNR